MSKAAAVINVGVAVGVGVGVALFVAIAFPTGEIFRIGIASE